MASIEKGTILSFEGSDRNGNPNKAVVQAYIADGAVSLPITIPWYLRGRMGALRKQTEVVFAIFDDATGIILSRMDGEWNEEMDGNVSMNGHCEAEVGFKTDGSIVAGETVTAANVISGGIGFNEHKHGGVAAGGSKTTTPS